MKCFLFLFFTLGAAFAQPNEDASALVGRLLLLAFPGPNAPLERLAEFEPGGFLLYSGNIPSSESLRDLTGTLQNAAKYPLLFGIDQEGGPFNSYRSEDAVLFPGQMALAATLDPALAERVGEATGLELASLGVNLVFGPVADVNSNPDNPIIGIRSFGAEPETVAAFALAYARGLEAGGVAAVAKHFPGHGDTSLDSHLDLPTVGAELARLEALELVPFKALIEAGIPGVMSAHVVFPALDEEVPATLSSPVLSGLLRENLGFSGLVVTDFMDMAAIAKNYGAGEAAVRSVLAGADLVLLGPDLERQREVYAALQEALRSGRLSEARVREAVARSEAVARRYPSNPQAQSAGAQATQARLALEVAERAATLLWNDDVLPLASNANVLVVSPKLTAYGPAPTLGEALAELHPETQSVTLSDPPTEAEIGEAVAATGEAEVIVLGSYHWQGAFAETLAGLEAQLAATGKPLVVVALGNPDDLRFLPQRPDAYLAVYGFRTANVMAAARVLTGQVAPGGKLPVPAGDYVNGAGLEGFR